MRLLKYEPVPNYVPNYNQLQLKFLIIFLLEPVHFRNVPGMGLGDACVGKGIQSGVVSG